MAKQLVAGLGIWLVLSTAIVASSKEEEAAAHTKVLKESTDSKAKTAAAEEIGRLGAIKKSYAVEAVPYLIKALKDKDVKLRSVAAVSLGRVDPPAETAVPALVELLKNDKEIPVKVAAMQGLMHMGPNAKEAVPAIREHAKKDADRRLMQAARAALKSIAAKN
jgi:HEAT repeat protein